MRFPVDEELRLDLGAMADAAEGAGVVFFCNPNNQTATVHGKNAVLGFIDRVHAASQDTVILMDEAYHDYVTDPAHTTAIPLALEAGERARVTHLLQGVWHGWAEARLRGRARSHARASERLQADVQH